MLKLMYITNDPRLARIAVDSGVDRIFIDMEVMGKAERQGHMDSVKSHHSFDDIRQVKTAIGNKGELIARINPFYLGTKNEVDTAIACGADILMLPMWRTAAEVEAFVRYAGGRVKTVALLETKEAEAALDEVLKIAQLDEVHIGLNDLHLSYGRRFLFELLADETVDRICRKLAVSGKSYGFGGVGRIGYGLLPADYIIAEHYRLGSTAVILSRSFYNGSMPCDYSEAEATFKKGVDNIRMREQEVTFWDEHKLQENHRKVQRCVTQILDHRRA